MSKYEQLMQELVCPDCKNRLTYTEHALECLPCRNTFPIKHRIPVFYTPKIVEQNVAAEYKYWNEKEHTPDDLYENMSDSAFQALLRLFKIQNNTRGLELGCGDGPFARRLSNKQLEIYGIDISFPLLTLTENMLPIQGNALKLPFQDNFFDWIIYAFALHHMPDHHKSLTEAVRVLGDKAKIFIVDPNYYHPIRFFTREPDMFLRKHVFTYLTPEERWISTRKVKRILTDHHVTIDAVLFVTPEFESPTIAGKMQRLLGKIFAFPPVKMFTQSYYVIIGTKIT